MSSMDAQIVRMIGESIWEEFAPAAVAELPVTQVESVRTYDERPLKETLAFVPRSEKLNKETAFINRDGVLIMHYWSKLGNLIAEAWDHIAPTEPHYLDLCFKHGLKNVGDRNEIFLEWSQGSWRKVA